MAKMIPCWPSSEGDFRLIMTRGTAGGGKQLQEVEAGAGFIEQQPYSNGSTISFPGIASLGGSITYTNNSTSSGGFSNVVPVSSYNAVDYTDTPIPNHGTLNNMTGFRTTTTDNIQSTNYYSSRVTVPNNLKVYPPVIDMRENLVRQEFTRQAKRRGSRDEQEHSRVALPFVRSSDGRMARRTRSWPRVAGDSRRPARSTPYEDKRRRLQETDHELAKISPSEFPHPPYPNDTASLHGIASLDNSTTSHSSTDPFSVGFHGTGLGQVPVPSYYTYYAADYTNTPIPNRRPMQNMTGFRAMTADNVLSAYPGRVSVPKALNVYTSGTNMGKNPIASELNRGIPMPRAQRRGPWDEEEHRNFLRGVNKCGWSRWKLIAEKYVTTRDEYQICSHAQKYRSHFNNGSSSSGKTPRKKQESIHDTSLKDESGKALPLPVPPRNKGDGPAMQLPLPLPEDSRGGQMQLLLDLLPPPPPPGRGGDTDPASILHEQMSEENDETQSSDSFDIGDFLLDSPDDQILDQ